MATRPKEFTAARAITYRGQRYQVGDPVEDRRTIAALVRYGDRFLTVKRSKSAPAETPAVDTATTPQPESTKED
jgi:hypothetical protein